MSVRQNSRTARCLISNQRHRGACVQCMPQMSAPSESVGVRRIHRISCAGMHCIFFNGWQADLSWRRWSRKPVLAKPEAGALPAPSATFRTRSEGVTHWSQRAVRMTCTGVVDRAPASGRGKPEQDAHRVGSVSWPDLAVFGRIRQKRPVFHTYNPAKWPH